MMTQKSFEQMTDAEILATFGMESGESGRRFDTETQARVFADGLIRARGRFANYRTLYGAFVSAGTAYMIENLDEEGDGQAVPAKLIFSDEPPTAEIEESPSAMVWTERTLLEALIEERAIQDFFADLLTELAPQLD